MNLKYDCWINGEIYTKQGIIKEGYLMTNSNGTIEDVGNMKQLSAYPESVRAHTYDLKGSIVLPGFIDVHVHGGNGFQVMDATYESLDGMSQFHARHGTTAFLATTSTASYDRIAAALKNSDQSMKRGLTGAELLGIHLEGPYLNAIRCGAQDTAFIRQPDLKEIKRFISDSGHQIRLVTLAPENEGGLQAVKKFVESGITVSIGHSNAALTQVEAAISVGVNHTTHHFNGMSPFHHREPGVAGAGMLKRELTTELIADGVHVHPESIKLLFEIKGADHVCLITDAVRCAGLPDGEYGRVYMKHGEIYLKDGSSLAGSSLTMVQSLRNMLHFTGLSIEYILPSLTTVPARQIGVIDRKGTLEKGKDADFVVLDDRLNVQTTVVKGTKVFSLSE